MKRATLALFLLVACSEDVAPNEEALAVAPSKTSIGRANEDAIVGGITDTRRSYVVGVGSSRGAFCSGTLISRRVVVTAGHCYGGISAVITGTKLDGDVLRVKREVLHPEFDRGTLSHDLSLLELEEDAPMQPAPLLREDMNEDPSAFLGPKASFVGYGYSNGNTGAGFGTRRVATFAIEAVGPAQLEDGFTTDAIDETMFYYRLDDKNTCNGDSGGPAFFTRDGVERHAGVTSFGDAGCVKDGVQQRTDQPAIDGFIQAFIDEVEGDDPCRNNGICEESCNNDGKLVDPDCAANHCQEDGLCVLSCTQPVDPDCTGDVCGEDGVCDPSCATPDKDCAR